jgi:5'-3' exonuclease
LSGQHAGGIIGFLNGLRQLIDNINPSMTIIAWESGGSARRKALFSGYKANRRPPKLNRYYEDDIPDTNENRLYQAKVLVSLLRHTPVCQLFVENCEADDIIGYLCRNKLKNEKKVVASSDRDFYQLIDDNTIMYSFSSKKFIGASDVIKEFNISPDNFVLAKAVCGDTSDAIPGVKGVGFKTLSKRFDMVSKQLSVNELIEMSSVAKENSNVKIYGQICENSDIIRRNWRLMYLDVANLSATQARAVDAAVENFKPSQHQMKFMKMMIDEGLQSFDCVEFFSSFKYANAR